MIQINNAAPAGNKDGIREIANYCHHTTDDDRDNTPDFDCYYCSGTGIYHSTTSKEPRDCSECYGTGIAIWDPITLFDAIFPPPDVSGWVLA